MSEKLCLQWNDFRENAISTFGNLREDADFADVTLACEDGEQVEAHKVILAALSPFFQNLMEKTSKKNENGNLLHRCKVCGNEAINTHMKTHIEANHLEGVVIPCNLCESTFRSRHSLNMHNRRNHNRNKES